MGVFFEGAENDEPVAQLWHAEPGCAHHLGGKVIAKRPELLENGNSQAAVVHIRGDRGHVLHHEVPWPQLADVIRKGPEREVALIMRITRAALRHSLTHRATEDDVDVTEL